MLTAILTQQAYTCEYDSPRQYTGSADKAFYALRRFTRRTVLENDDKTVY